MMMESKIKFIIYESNPVCNVCCLPKILVPSMSFTSLISMIKILLELKLNYVDDLNQITCIIYVTLSFIDDKNKIPRRYT